MAKKKASALGELDILFKKSDDQKKIVIIIKSDQPIGVTGLKTAIARLLDRLGLI